MTVATSSNRADFTGNGSTTVFPYTFRIFEAADLVVTKADTNGTETVLVLNTDYTVSGAGSYNGGNVTLAVALPNQHTLTIQRVLNITQETDLRNQGAFFAETHEDVFDRLTMITQQLQEQLDRAAIVPVTSAIDVDNLAADLVRLAESADNIDTVVANLADITTIADDLNELVSEINTVATSIANVDAVGGNIAAVLAVNSNATNINTVAGQISPTNRISAVAGISADITTVAGISANVTTVAGISANVTTVAGNSANVTTVAGISSSVTTVAGINAAVSTVADADADIGTVASNIASVTDVAASIANINTVAGLDTEIAAVVADATDIGTVALNIADVSTVAGISANVTTVAGMSADIAAVVADEADIGTVATNLSDVTAVSAIVADVSTVAGLSADITAVAADATDIGTVAADLAGANTISAVAAIAANVSTVAGISADIGTVADNVADITNFSDVYLGPKTSDPSTRNDSSTLQLGDLYFNTALDTLKIYTSTGWVVAVFDIEGAGVGSFNGRTGVVTLSSTDVTDALGFTPIDGIDSSDVTTALGFTPISGINSSDVTTALGFTPISGISSSDVTTALGYTPLSTINSGDVVSALGYTPLNKAGDSMSGDLTFTGNGRRIKGDFSNATVTNRLIFQTSTADSATTVEAIPSGTSRVAQFLASNGTDPDNTSTAALTVLETEVRLQAGSRGTGSLLPIAVYSGGFERARFKTTGETEFKKAVQEAKTAISASAIDLAEGNYFTKTISGTTTFTVSNVASSGTVSAFVLDLTNGGSATVNWWSGTKWAGGAAPTLTTSGRDVLGFFTHDGGTTWNGFVLGLDVK